MPPSLAADSLHGQDSTSLLPKGAIGVSTPVPSSPAAPGGELADVAFYEAPTDQEIEEENSFDNDAIASSSGIKASELISALHETGGRGALRRKSTMTQNNSAWLLRTIERKNQAAAPGLIQYCDIAARFLFPSSGILT